VCPDCSGRLSPWGFARSREVRTLDGVRRLRSRRASCGACDATHVLCPSWSVPRRRDSAEIGEALRLAAGGQGHRRIARRLDRPPGTVRGWLRAARARAEHLRACAVRWTYTLDPGESQRGDPSRQRAVRRRRGDHARRPRVGTALRSPANRTMGAGGVDDRRPAVRPATAPAVATSPRGRAPARRHRHPAAHGGWGSSAAAAPPACSPPPSLGA
jgi:hypothetical protein